MTTTATPCTQPGCAGTIEDGYCTVCGMAAAPVPARAAAAASGPAGPPVSRPGSASISGSAPASASGRAGTRTTRGTSRSSRGNLGAGLVEIPPVPARDPAGAVLADPQVPEAKRFCPKCEHPVGRARDGRPGLAEGFCRNCGTRFSFSPKLHPGDLVGGQYEVLGCLAHGGLGWIYLARDRNVSDSWRVLKGLLNTGDPDAMAAAVAERQFLAAVDHPNIVRIYNFVQHRDPGGETAGYIVMEYVGGRSLREILLGERAAGRSIPVEHALAYAIEVLRALGYLHSRGLVYCDFKPDNVIQTEEMLRLIDMGGVRRIDDEDSPIYGTVGYQAPEIAADGPSPSSDLYTVGRALAVLTFEFTGYRGTFEHSLPDPATVPLLARQESFYRLLRRATDPDPGRRFGSAGEMAEQLTGVLRQVLAVADGDPRPAFSTLFTPELQAVGAEAAMTGADGHAGDVAAAPPAVLIAAALPVPQVDSADPAAGYLASLSTLEAGQRTATLAAAVSGDGTPAEVAGSAETRLALARAQIVTGALDQAAATLANLAASEQADWRVTWYQGLRALAAAEPAAARAAFDAVYDALPGELAPQLGLGFAAEAAADPVTAARYFRLVWTVDRSLVSAAFGLARVLLATGDRSGAIAALAGVPPTSSYHVAAQIAAVRIHLSPADSPAGGSAGNAAGSPAGGRSGGPARIGSLVSAADLREAARRLDRLTLDPDRRLHLAVTVLGSALDRVAAGQPLGEGALLGCEPTERALRFQLEQSYRAMSRLAPDLASRISLVDRANLVRPRTWL